MVTMHPGEYIKEVYIEGNGMTVRELSEKLGVSRMSVWRLVNCKTEVSREMAVRLETELGRSAKSWLSMQDSYSLPEIRRKLLEGKV